MTKVSMESGRRWATLFVALVFLDASLTFDNFWPTPAVKWLGRLSVELGGCLLLLAALARWRGSISVRVVRALSVLWVVLIIGRYADVTAPAIFGRPINLYWDSRHLSAVGAMLATSASAWLVVAVVAAAVLLPLLLYWPSRRALGRIGVAMSNRVERRVLATFGATLIVLFAVSPRTVDPVGVEGFGMPVLGAYAAQGSVLVRELVRGPKDVGPTPPMTSDLSRIAGADVFLIFIESYGAVSYDRTDLTTALATSRAAFAADVRDSGRRVVSAFVESPTFGGSSWLAHVSLMSGIEVRDEDTSVALMSQRRDTVVSTFARHGFRTIALMPGLQQVWPEGDFYRFDTVYRGQTLEYRGPDFGWWSVPDQFSIAKVDQLEVNRQPRAPVFIFFPTISTHTPFGPVAPYQSDWPRMLTDTPYDDAVWKREYLYEPEWLNLGPSYVRAIEYDFASIGGYLRFRSDRDFVMVLIGDHQPPAAVSGTGSRWDVPVHIVASRPAVLERLMAKGFREGLMPAPAPIAKMHQLTTILLDSFGGSHATE